MAASALSATNIRVAPGGDLQGAINNAQPGDIITLSAGGVYTGNYVLPARAAATAYITIQSSAASQLLANKRVTPSSIRTMAAIVTPNSSPAIDAADGANHFRFIGIEFHPAAGVYVFDLVRLGNGSPTFAAMPHDFVFDRVYIHGDPTVGSKRGLTLNCSQATIENSYVSNFKSTAQDTQAIAGWNGPGPFTITNNYLEAAGENILFGDPAPTISGLVPSDITVRGNYFSKPLSWRPGDPSYAGTPWSVKNLFELKSAQRVTVSGNVFENSWISSQDGFAIVLTVRTQDGGNPTAVIKDVTFTGNLVRHAGHGVNILGVDANGEGQSSNLVISDNAFLDITGAVWASSPGRLFQIINKVEGLTIQRNIGLQDGPMVMADEAPSTGLVFSDNVVQGQGGFLGSGTASANSTLSVYFPGGVIAGNAFVDGNPAQYPVGNFFPASLDSVGFVNIDALDFCLRASSPYGATGVSAAFAPLATVVQAALAGTAVPVLP